MDKAAATIVIGIVLLITLPFFILYLNKKRKDIKFLNQFANFAHKENIIISRKEFWDHKYAIGIDNKSKKIVYATKLKEEVTGTIIDLNQVEKCRVVSINKTNKNQNGNNSQSDCLELAFTFRNSELPEKVLEFYNNSEFMPSVEERSHIENWLKIVNSNLN